MILYVKNHNFNYELEKLIRIFFPNDKIVQKDYLEMKTTDNEYVYTELSEEKDKYDLKMKVKLGEFEVNKEANVEKIFEDNLLECERVFAVNLFEILKNFTKRTPPWGILSGVRPVKLLRTIISEAGKEGAVKYFKEKFLVNENKIKKSLDVLGVQDKILKLSKENSFSLYVAIPFCPTRCSYCSFVSHSIERTNKLIPIYLELLLKELEYTGKIVKELKLRLESVYIGGGTPTTLDHNQLIVLIESIYKNFDMNTCREFTVEAGRPDTINEEKLKVLKLFGVTRISINPQTFKEETLKLIGRKHTVEDTLNAYNLAVKCGIDNINMDLIAGLPGEDQDDFINSLENVCKLGPKNITIHTLSLKRASRMNFLNTKIAIEDDLAIEKMLNFSDEKLYDENYYPYYLYRQSKMLGNLENTGFSKRGFENLYNIFIMEEIHSIISCGASGITKLKNPYNGQIERICNFKFAYEYIDRFNEVISRKDRVRIFYEEFSR